MFQHGVNIYIMSLKQGLFRPKTRVSSFKWDLLADEVLEAA